MSSATKPLPHDGKDAQSLGQNSNVWGSRSIQSAGSNPAFEVRRLAQNLTGEVRARGPEREYQRRQIVLISACPAPSQRQTKLYESTIDDYITMLLVPHSTTLAPYHNYLALPSG
jgi:hypothetical protein